MPLALPGPEDLVLSGPDATLRPGPLGGSRPPHGAPVRTHLPDGHVLTWSPGARLPGSRVALDAEYADAPVPAHLARRYGTADFWTRWTRAEVCAKLSGTPILLWLAAHGLPDDPGRGTAYALVSLDVAGPCGRTVRVCAGAADRVSP